MEVEMPILHPAELWEETGRWKKYLEASVAFHLEDRKGARFILAPTAEEPMTSFARNNLTTYRDLPVTLWQMSPKFRDELRPRQGLIRGREFVMKDAYSFDADEEGMRRSSHQAASVHVLPQKHTPSGRTVRSVAASFSSSYASRSLRRATSASRSWARGRRGSRSHGSWRSRATG